MTLTIKEKIVLASCGSMFAILCLFPALFRFRQGKDVNVFFYFCYFSFPITKYHHQQEHTSTFHEQHYKEAKLYVAAEL